MRALVYILLLAICFTSCKSVKPTVKTEHKVVDTTTTKVTHVIKFDTIRVAADSLKVSIPIAKLSETPITATSQTGRIKASVKRVNNAVEIDCYVDELIKIIESQNTIIETLTKRHETNNTTVTEIKYRTRWYMKALAFVGGLIVLIVGIKYLKPLLKPF